MSDPALGALTDAVAGVEPSISADVDDDAGGTPEGRRIIELLWTGAAPASRGPKPKFSLDDIVRAGVSVADRRASRRCPCGGSRAGSGWVSCRYTRTSPAAPSCWS